MKKTTKRFVKKSGKKSWKTGIIAALSILAIVGVIAFAIFCASENRKKNNDNGSNNNSTSQSGGSDEIEFPRIPLDPEKHGTNN